MSELKVIISGGGTGGHIFPAIAIANALVKRKPGIKILFVGANERMEMEKVPQAGYDIRGLNIAGFQRGSIIKNLTLPFKLVGSLLSANNIVKSFKPDVAIGVGGYASGPLLRVAGFAGVPTVIQEQNSFAGITNKLLAKKASVICTAYEGMEKVFPKEKIVLTGNPVRAEIVAMQTNGNALREEAYKYFGLDPNRKTILIIGGSLGARTLNESVESAINRIKESDVQMLWQTGKVYSEYCKQISDGITQLKTLQFIDRMDFVYACADVIISRAGALSISELQLIGKPVILVPSPNVTEDHQTYNAMALVNKGAAIMIKDSEAKLNLIGAAFDLLKNKEQQKQLSANISKMGIANAAERIVDEILKSKQGQLNMSTDIKNIKRLFFLGIGGIGMSALARYFKSQGAEVSGYDKTQTHLTDELESEGIHVMFEDDVDKMPRDLDLVVYTPAIPKDHKGFNFYKDNRYELRKRSEVLGIISADKFTIAVAGSHGKTTVSSMIAHILTESGFGCSAFLGGIAVNYNSNFLLGNSDVVVIEADEFDRSFHRLSPDMAVITAVDTDHLDIYGSKEAIDEAFLEFANKVSEEGFLVIKNGQAINDRLPEVLDIAFYDLHDTDADVYCTKYWVTDGGYLFNINFFGQEMTGFRLNIGGFHNIENALAAITIAFELKITEENIRKAVASFKGIRRRFEKILDTEKVVYIDDYAHHPEEIRVFLESVREIYPKKKITAIFQPHLFSRTRDLAEGFAKSLSLVDEVILLEIYPARELPMDGVTSALIYDQLTSNEKLLINKNDLLGAIKNKKDIEVLVTIGAGDIDKYVEGLKQILSN